MEKSRNLMRMKSKVGCISAKSLWFQTSRYPSRFNAKLSDLLTEATSRLKVERYKFLSAKYV